MDERRCMQKDLEMKSKYLEGMLPRGENSNDSVHVVAWCRPRRA